MSFTAEINITSQGGFDMTLDCPRPGIAQIKQHLKSEGFGSSSLHVDLA